MKSGAQHFSPADARLCHNPSYPSHIQFHSEHDLKASGLPLSRE